MGRGPIKGSKSEAIRDVIYNKKEAFCQHEIYFDAKEINENVTEKDVYPVISKLERTGGITRSTFSSTCKYSSKSHRFYMVNKKPDRPIPMKPSIPGMDDITMPAKKVAPEPTAKPESKVFKIEVPHGFQVSKVIIEKEGGD